MCLSENILPKYTDFRLHDARLRRADFTVEFRRTLIKDQLSDKLHMREGLERELESWKSKFINFDPDREHEFLRVIENTMQHHKNLNLTIISRKLSKLYRGELLLPEVRNNIHNIAGITLTPMQKEVLALGLNFHLAPKFDPYVKNCQLERLYQQILNHKLKGDLDIKDDLEIALLAESKKNTGNNFKPTLSKSKYDAIKQLKNNESVVLRKADKSRNYVILTRQDYKAKLDLILSDENKFCKLQADPTNDIKR